MDEAGTRWIDALPDLARERLPAPVWHYFATGSGDGTSAAEAGEAWRRVRLSPHALRDVTAVDTSVRLLGTPYAQPFGIAPTSLQRAATPEGERAMARAASVAGVPHVVSSNAGFPLSEVGAIGPWWLQAYLTADRADTLPVLRVAADAGAGAVVLTADTPVVGSKRGADDADWAGVDLSWHRGNFAGHVRDSPGVWARDVTEADVAWLAETTGLPVVVKGILRPDDARRCVGAGAAAVWVSNHGGRQLDRAVASATALPAVAGEVGGEVEVYVDGGVRSGLDVLTALALGADAAFLGRTPLYALAAAGQDGVTRLLHELAGELLEALRLAGCRDLREARDLLPAIPDSPAG